MKFLPKYHVKSLILVWLVCIVGMLNAQIIVPDTTFYEQKILSYLETHELLPDSVSLNINGLSEVENRLEKEKGISRRISPEISIALNNFVASKDTNLYSNIDKLVYSNLQIGTRISLGDIPFSLGGNLVWLDGAYNANLSTFIFSFDEKQFLNNLKIKHYSVPKTEDFFNPTRNILDLTEQELEEIEKRKRFLYYQQVISHPKFRAHKSELENKTDSLIIDLQKNIGVDTLIREGNSWKYTIDSVINSNQNHFNTDPLDFAEMGLQDRADSAFLNNNLNVDIDTALLYKYEESLDLLYEVEDNYKKAWRERSRQDYRTWRQIEEKTKTFDEKLKQIENPKNLKERLLNENRLSPFQKILMNTKGLELGQYSLHDSELTARYLNLTGINYEYTGSSVFGQVAYGNQVLPSLFFFQSDLNHKNQRRYLFLKGGIGKETANYTQISYLQVNEKDLSGDSTFVFPKQNRVVAWKGQLAFEEQLGLTSEFAFSDLDFGNQSAIDFGNQSGWNSQKMAIATKFSFKPKSNKLKIGTGYFYTGPQYSSLGNPFLLTNRQGVSLEAKGDLFNRRIILNGTAKYGKSIDESLFNAFKDFQFLGEATFRFGKRNSLKASVMPNVYNQNIYDNQEVRSQNVIYSVQGTFVKKIKRTQAITVFNMTNLRTNFQILDSTQINNSVYLYLQEMVILTERQSLNFTGMLGTENGFSTNFSDVLFQTDYSIAFDRLSLTAGIQYIKDQYTKKPQYGFINSLNFKPFPNSTLSLFWNYRNTFEQYNLFNPSQLTANLSFQYQINFKRNE